MFLFGSLRGDSYVLVFCCCFFLLVFFCLFFVLIKRHYIDYVVYSHRHKPRFSVLFNAFGILDTTLEKTMTYILS